MADPPMPPEVQRDRRQGSGDRRNNLPEPTWYYRLYRFCWPPRDAFHATKWRALSIWIIGFSLIVFFILWRLDDTRRDNCTRVSGVLTKLFVSNQRSLGKLGTPGYAYYREHPDELEAAKVANQKFVDEVNPDKCN